MSKVDLLLKKFVQVPSGRVNSTLKIGLFGIGLDVYWEQFDGLKKRLEGMWMLEPVRIMKEQ